MSMPGGLTIAFLGFLLGVEHSLEPDHLVAVSTLITERSGVRRASLIGVNWGLGHSLVLTTLGLFVLGFGLRIPDQLAWLAELLVGSLLVVLGLRAIWRARSGRLHLHPHQHGTNQAPHLHIHPHPSDRDHEHSHSPVHQGSFLVGMLHGMAGSAALMLLILGTVNSIPQGIGYLVAFGLGSIAGMALVSALVGYVMHTWSQRVERFQGGLRVLAGAASILIGGLLILRTLPIL